MAMLLLTVTVCLRFRHSFSQGPPTHVPRRVGRDSFGHSLPRLISSLLQMCTVSQWWSLITDQRGPLNEYLTMLLQVNGSKRT